ncbi:MAG: DNA-binding protein [Spirochaetes bacterium]|nr:DNA-binding protein [Spirochaetota bacterium]
MNLMKSVQTYMGKLNHDGDLLNELTQFCQEKNIKLGRIQAIGAVKKATLAYYNQDKREYEYFTLDKHLEILDLVGNISIRDGKPMVHAHITLADQEGKAFGGHLAEGTIIFACEAVIEVYEGNDLVRGYDEQTSLPLWS